MSQNTPYNKTQSEQSPGENKREHLVAFEPFVEGLVKSAYIPEGQQATYRSLIYQNVVEKDEINYTNKFKGNLSIITKMEVGFLSSKFLLKYDGATLKLEVTGLICSNHNATKFITPLQEGHIPNAVAVDKLLSDTKEIRSRHAILPSSEQATINSNTPPAEQKNKTFKKRL